MELYNIQRKNTLNVVYTVLVLFCLEAQFLLGDFDVYNILLNKGNFSKNSQTYREISRKSKIINMTKTAQCIRPGRQALHSPYSLMLACHSEVIID